jgi:beta-lactamase class A
MRARIRFVLVRTLRAVNRRAFVAGSSALPFCVTSVASSATLEAKIERIAAYSSGTLGVFARKLGSASTIEYNADVVFPAASIIKMCIFLCIYQYAEHHPDVFNERRRLERDDFIGGSEILDAYNPGDTISIGKLVHAMIEQSDNTASNVLISFLGFERIKASIASAGLEHTQLRRHFLDYAAILHHSENLSTPRDMGKLLYALERGAHEGVRTVVSPIACRAMIDIMLQQEDRDKLYRGLPKGTPLANKTGEIDGVRNDVGIVDPFGEAPYVIAVFTKDLADFSLGNSAIRRVSAVVHDVFA